MNRTQGRSSRAFGRRGDLVLDQGLQVAGQAGQLRFPPGGVWRLHSPDMGKNI
jgi:hypothetical protein